MDNQCKVFLVEFCMILKFILLNRGFYFKFTEISLTRFHLFIGIAFHQFMISM